MQRSIPNAFTLTEILIVIGIIGVVTVVPMLAYSQLSQNARDGRRKQDLSKVATALQEYRSQVGRYPNAANYDGLAAILIPQYLTALPEDPAKSKDYEYQVDSSGLNYMLIAKLDKKIDGVAEVYVHRQASQENITGTPALATGYLSPTGPNPLSYTPLPSKTPTNTPSPTPGGSTTWVRRYGPNTSIEASAMLNGSSFINVGSYNAGVPEGLIQYTNSGGVLTSGTRYVDPTSPNGLQFTNVYFDGTATFVVGNALNSGNWSPILMKLNSAKQVEWVKKLNFSRTARVYSVTKYVNSIYISGAVDLQEMFIGKYDMNGDLEKLVKLTINSITSEFYPYDIRATTGGNIMVGGVINDTRGLILNINNVLTGVNWATSFYSQNDTNIFRKILPLAGGANGYIAVGETDGTEALSVDGWVLQTDTSGTLVNSKRFGTAQVEGFTNISMANDGGYLLTGLQKPSLVGESDASVLKITTGFVPVWYKEIGVATASELISGVHKLTSGYYLSGNSNDTSPATLNSLTARMSTAGSIASCTEFQSPAILSTSNLTATQTTLNNWVLGEFLDLNEVSLSLTEASYSGTTTNSCN